MFACKPVLTKPHLSYKSININDVGIQMSLNHGVRSAFTGILAVLGVMQHSHESRSIGQAYD